MTLAAADDNDGIDGTATFTHTAANGDYDGVTADLTATEGDDDRGLTLSTTSLSVAETKTATYTVKLATDPAERVKVTISATGDRHLKVDTDAVRDGRQDTLVFTSDNYSTEQTVTVSASQDGDGLDGQTAFTHTAACGDDCTYDDEQAVLRATEADKDRILALDTGSWISVHEGKTETYHVWLQAQPVAPVRVTAAIVSGGDPDLSIRSGASLEFTPSSLGLRRQAEGDRGGPGGRRPLQRRSGDRPHRQRRRLHRRDQEVHRPGVRQRPEGAEALCGLGVGARGGDGRDPGDPVVQAGRGGGR